ncbi:MAG: hypothetical protein Q8N45_02835 [Anaerolineales bacterium]|nr:hypothetical protein [Chloroflexota bacterium]MBU4352900.1 hypothetical protein [Nanoarchaeota archaeon]MDP2975130.1 hypothetical protein [Anaerolineales bacterium]
MSKIYVVKITRLVVCEDERQARETAAKEGNPEDVDEVVEVRDLSDIPEAWKTANPYGEGEAERWTSEQWWSLLLRQFEIRESVQE